MKHSRSRSERLVQRNKEAIERDRLSTRVGGFFRYDGPVDFMRQTTPCEVRVFTCAYGPLSTNFPDQRLHALQKSRTDREIGSILRAKRLDRSAMKRHEFIEREHTKGKSNISGAAFNIINQSYNQNIDGQRLKRLDELYELRRCARASYLAKKNHLGFDPITSSFTIPIVDMKNCDCFHGPSLLQYLYKW